MSEPTDMDCDEMPMDLTVRKDDEWPEQPRPEVEPEQRDDVRSLSSSVPNPVVPRPTPVIVPTAAVPVPLDVAVTPPIPLDTAVTPVPLDAAAARKPPPLTAVVPPHTADAGYAADSSSHRLSSATPLFFAAAPTPLPPPPPLPPTARQLLQQQQLDLALQQQQLQLQQQQQLRFQQQLRQHQQQLQLATFGGSHRSLDFDSVVLRAAHEMAAAAAAGGGGPLCGAMPLSPASSESNPFSFAGTYGCAHRSAAIHAGSFGYNNNNTCPYYIGMPGAGGQLSPESTTADDVHRRRRGVINLADLMTGIGGNVIGINPNVDAEDIADIYRTAEFQAFRQRYMDSLGPPRNYEKMRRSMPANKQRCNGGQPPAYDVLYAQKRMKNNEAAKKSRDAKRQKFLENQISVMYLTKKIREMNDLKRRLLISMT